MDGVHGALRLGDIEDERAARIRARAGDGAAEQAAFDASVERAAPAVDPAVVAHARERALTLEYDHAGLTTAAYLAHSFRVATLVIDLDAEVETENVVVGLLHNVLEVSDATPALLSEEVGERPAAVIEALTVDRTRQHDPVYKDAYYAALADGPRSGRVVKVADKLDNMFTLCLDPDADVRSRYLDEIERWVIPMAAHDLPALDEYLPRLVENCRTTGYCGPP
jgi:(p)ppGpp synthase/HD superfamily hydrolase